MIHATLLLLLVGLVLVFRTRERDTKAPIWRMTIQSRGGEPQEQAIKEHTPRRMMRTIEATTTRQYVHHSGHTCIRMSNPLSATVFRISAVHSRSKIPQMALTIAMRTQTLLRKHSNYSKPSKIHNGLTNCNRHHNRIIDVSHEISRRSYELERSGSEEWTRTRPGTVGDIDLIIVLLLRGDPRPPPLANKNIIPGPQGIDFMIKMSPAVLVNTDQPNVLVYKVLTTMHNPDIGRPDKRDMLKRDYVLMRLTSRDGRQMPRCFSSLNYVGTSKTYKFESPSFMPISSTYGYPRREPRRHLGHLEGINDNVELDKILDEEHRRMSRGNREVIRNYRPINAALPPPGHRNLSENLLSSPVRPWSRVWPHPPGYNNSSDNSPSSPMLPPWSSALLPSRTSTTVAPSAHPVHPQSSENETVAGAHTGKISEDVEDRFILEYFRNKEISEEDKKEIDFLRAKDRAKIREATKVMLTATSR